MFERKVGNPEPFDVPDSNAFYNVAAVKLQYYDGTNGAPFFYATTIATIFHPAATQFLIQTNYITQTLLQAFPFTVLSTVTRLTTITSSLTRTVTNLLTLSGPLNSSQKHSAFV